MKLSILKTAALIGAALALSSVASAVQITLTSATATLFDGNFTSDYFSIDGNTLAESGSATGSWSAVLSGTNNNTVTFTQTVAGDINLTAAFIKAANQYILWDSADLAGWNALNSTIGDQLVLVNTIIVNANGVIQSTSHAGLNGSGTGVPDGGATVALLGLGLAALALIRRKMTS